MSHNASIKSNTKVTNIFNNEEQQNKTPTHNAIVAKDQATTYNLQNNKPHKCRANPKIHSTTHHHQLLELC
jgi:hypothetical protein